MRPQHLSDDDLAWNSAHIGVELWRDYAPEARTVAGIALGSRRLTGDIRTAVADLHDEGVRYVQLIEPVHLCADVPVESVRALVLLRELTARGIAARWIARCDAGCGDHQDLAHLFPPAWTFGASNSSTTRWRAEFFPNRCVFRRGPGFVEVRDRRFGPLRRHVVTDTHILAALDELVDGVPMDRVPAAVSRDLLESRLVLPQAGHFWWLPAPIYGWPFSSMNL